MDKGRGASTEKKEEELADLQAKAQAATAAQVSTLADANKKMEEAAKVYEMVKDAGLRKYTYTEIDDAIKKYETARDEMRVVASKSKYVRSYKNPYES